MQLRNTLRTAFSRFTKDEPGATAVEYGLFVFLIAVAITLTVTDIGTNLVTVLGRVRDSLAG